MYKIYFVVEGEAKEAIEKAETLAEAEDLAYQIWESDYDFDPEVIWFIVEGDD